MRINFTKMNGVGNDFVVIDAINQRFDITKNTIKYLAHRNRGIGCDQVLLIEPPKRFDIDFHYRIFNRDGSEVEQCGNGARCVAKFIHDNGLSGKKKIKISTLNNTLELEVLDSGDVLVMFEPPIFEPSKIPLNADKEEGPFHVKFMNQKFQFIPVNVGNPHAVIFDKDIRKINLKKVGSFFQKHDQFPKQVNVNFAQVINKDLIKLRVFERGSGITESCGSGACATAAAAIRGGLVNPSVKILQRGGQLLINWNGSNTPIKMTGEAKTIYHGHISV